MRDRRIAAVAPLAIVIAALACGSTKTDPPPLATPDDFTANLNDPRSCVIDCDPACTEASKPWSCPALGEYKSIPHAPACGAFNGAFPAPAPGACTATTPSGDALAKTTIKATPVVLPDGRRVDPAGTEWVFQEKDMPGGFPSNALLVPGTRWLLVDDTGYETHSVRVLDGALLRAGGATSPVVSAIKFPPPRALNWGLAYVAATSTLFVASGIPDSKVFAFDLDVATGKLTQNDAKTVSLAPGAFPQGIAVSADGKTLLVGQAKDSNAVLVISLQAGTYGRLTKSIDVGRPDVFAVRFDPNDPSGNTAYATMWRGVTSPTDASKMVVMQLDVAAGTASAIVVGKAPEDMAFLDARYMVVANALGDSLSIIDRPAAKVAADVPLSATAGVEPTSLAYDPARRRLYAALSSANAVGVYDVDLGTTPPTLAPLGVIPTAWWPTSISIDPADGALFVTYGKGHGLGTDSLQRGLNKGAPTYLYNGSVGAIPFLDNAALALSTAKHKLMNDVASMPGYPTVQCNGAPNDFPIPSKIEDGRSTKIKHVFFVVRENKTFDAIMGDMPGVDGDPKLVMAPGRMDEIWPNARAIGAQFAHMDNFYEDAEQSIQGHVWTVFGRTTDYDERRWLTIWGRGEFGVTSVPGIGEDTAPREGSIFQDLKSQGVSVENMGEFVGGLAFRDTRWPGGTTNSVTPDTPAACYLAARARVMCDAAEFTYVWLANDHGFGLAEGKPNPGLMVAVNDEATGMLLDGISRSPIWNESLVIVVEDDPQDGGDHVDQHRTIALFASPWVKRGYVSHGHYDMASVHKLFAHVFGKKYRSSIIANAPLPLDLFTSTPDFSPYRYIPRRYADLACNPGGTTGAKAAEGWDFSEPDDQPGLSQQNWEYLRSLGGARP